MASGVAECSVGKALRYEANEGESHSAAKVAGRALSA
jgi:hypothetical protein